MKSHFVCGLIWRWNDDIREVEFVVIDSVSTDPKTGRKSKKEMKFPGGCNRVPDEPIELTLQREILEETYLAILPNNAREIWKKEVGGGEHTKYGFLINEVNCRGELRKEFLNDHGDEMSPPRYERVSVLKHALYPGHQEPFAKALEYLEYQGLV